MVPLDFVGPPSPSGSKYISDKALESKHTEGVAATMLQIDYHLTTPYLPQVCDNIVSSYVTFISYRLMDWLKDLHVCEVCSRKGDVGEVP